MVGSPPPTTGGTGTVGAAGGTGEGAPGGVGGAGGAGVPGTAVPQLPQKATPSAFAVPQLGQFIPVLQGFDRRLTLTHRCCRGFRPPQPREVAQRPNMASHSSAERGLNT